MPDKTPKMTTPNLIAASIRTYRERNGLSQAAMSAATGISQAQIYQLEAGNDLPSFPTLQALARFLGLHAEAIGKFVLEAAVKPRRDSALRQRRFRLKAS